MEEFCVNKLCIMNNCEFKHGCLDFTESDQVSKCICYKPIDYSLKFRFFNELYKDYQYWGDVDGQTVFPDTLISNNSELGTVISNSEIISDKLEAKYIIELVKTLKGQRKIKNEIIDFIDNL